MGADGLLSFVLGEVVDPATARSRSEFPEQSPLTPPPSFLKLALTASNLSIFSRTTAPVVPGWTLEYVVENDTGRVKLRKSADRLEGLETNLCCFCFAKLSPGAGAESGTVLIET